MKLRIKGDSLRLRLTRGEVQALADQGVVEDRARFGPGRALVYRLRRDPSLGALTATLDQGAIEVRVPAAAANEWCSTDLVTLAGTQANGDGEMRVIVEKDFACLAPREGEDESDNFPHPEAGAGKTC